MNWKINIFSKPVDDALVMKILESIDDASNIETSSGVIKPAWGKRNVDVSIIKFHQILYKKHYIFNNSDYPPFLNIKKNSKRFLNVINNLYIIESPLFLKILKILKNDI